MINERDNYVDKHRGIEIIGIPHQNMDFIGHF